jgi:hypothetical protein
MKSYHLQKKKWMEVEITLSEIRQSQKDNHLFSLMWDLDKSHEVMEKIKLWRKLDAYILEKVCIWAQKYT